MAEVRLKRLQLETGIVDPYQLIQAQLKLGKEIGRQYGVDVVVGCEISAGKEHRTCYGADVPFFPYEEWQERAPQDALNSHVAKHGGLTSINHAFSDLKRQELSDEERWAEVDKRVEEFVSQDAYGSKLIEVGFPEGRHGLDITHYLSLWDRMNLADLRVCGIGVSDAHSNVSWENGNHFANYVAPPDCQVQNLVAGMTASNFYMTDPYRLRGKVRFSTDTGKTMGETQSGGYVTLALSDAPADAELAWVLDGQPQPVERVGGRCESRFCIDGGRHFVRAELRDAQGRMILFTNPLWIG